MVAFLLEAGASVNGFLETDLDNLMKLILSNKEAHLEDFKQSLIDKSGTFPFHESRGRYNEKCVTPLVNAISSSWYLEEATQFQTVGLLLEAGADVNRISTADVYD